ncbi:MAG: hypothetical protein FRX48_04937 [Lasallia pustulata]|uniref:Protein kinase domain-containing protein n=1 Tax=Lasallia pustulata TaxID=136370 RepID=A0A5M8PQ03_9LECA|nr:MAG: hypothetical protein FRX48_04937 [Lasallia pustulata]
MECIRGTILPRRLTQMFADTKKCYENVVQIQDPDSQSSSIYRKLRIQKDRLVAWGLEWCDSNAAYAGDIDGSLDRAGISDLVASIMSSIKDLLDEAERIRSPESLHIPGTFPSEKGMGMKHKESQWTFDELTRLGDIVKDLTTSIDTLCDLSRSQRVLRHHPDYLGSSEKDPLQKSSAASTKTDHIWTHQNPKSAQILGAPILASVPRYHFNNDKDWYIVECVLEDGRECQLSRSYEDFYDFQTALLQKFPIEAGQRAPYTRTIPYMPGPVTKVTDYISSSRRESLNDYLKELLTLPPHISKCELIRQLFKPRLGDSERDLNKERGDDQFSSPFSVEQRGILASTHIHPKQLQLPDSSVLLGASPPPYESVAAGTERVLGSVKTSQSSHKSTKGTVDITTEIPILVEYGSTHDVDPVTGKLPALDRYEELISILDNSADGNKTCEKGTLKLLGWSVDPRQHRYAFIYELPKPPLDMVMSPSNPHTAHSLLSFLQHAADADSNNMPGLEDRYRLSFKLASGLLHLHAKGSTHRNVNSNNVLFFSNDPTITSANRQPWKEGLIRHPYLTSFDQCRDDVCNMPQEPMLENIYRHPGTERGQRSTYRAAHDLYSLGLILLEVGLWMPLSKFCKPRYTRADLKSRLQSIYAKKLAAKCGRGYMHAVGYCLEAADEANDSFGSSSQHQQYQDTSRKGDSRVQMDFYWKVVKPLERCCMIEEPEVLGASQHPYIGATALAQQDASVQPENTSSGSYIDELAARQELEATPVTETAAVAEAEPSPPPSERRFRIWSYELPTAHTKYWNSTMFPQLERILAKIIDRWESCSIDLCMTGETPEVARPTIYMICTSTEKARKALRYVNRDKRLFDIKVVKGEISRSKAGKKKRKRALKENKLAGDSSASRMEANNPECIGKNLHHQQRPSCGASIGAFRDNEHLPPVSFGGTVLVDGKPYGMSVHHMLDNDEIDLGFDDSMEGVRSMAPQIDASLSKHTWCDEPAEALYPFEISEDEDDGYGSSTEDDESWLFDASALDTSSRTESYDGDEDDVAMGDWPGVAPGRGEDLIITQPAIDDVDDRFFPNEDDKDEEHLSSHTFGHVYASSGIKRTSKNSIKHEIDWALIEVNEERVRDQNLVLGGRRHCKLEGPGNPLSADTEDSYPCHVMSSDYLGGLQVHALGRTSGLQTGFILPGMSLIKMPGRTSFSHSWQVVGGFGVGGDSGAWIIDNASNRICGHVLAWSSKTSIAYLAPMELLLEDMARVLHADVAFPPGRRALPQQGDCHVGSADTSAAAAEPAAKAVADELSWLAVSYTEEVVGEALARPRVGGRAAGKGMVKATGLVEALRREVEVCGGRGAAAEVTA